jgi:RNA polymerase sigma-70 factor (ECF subfamily)
MSPATLEAACPRTLSPHEAVDHLTRLYRLAWSLSGSRQLAEDATQETYVRVLSRPRKVRVGRDFQYLAQTLRNVATDHWRAERRRPATEPELPDAVAAPGTDPEVAALAGQVYTAMAELPDHLREVTAAIDVAGMTYAEAAQTLRIPPGTVMSRLFRARARLAGSLAIA